MFSKTISGHIYILTIGSSTRGLELGKRKVLNESELKDLKLPFEGELLGRAIKLLGGDRVMVKCMDGMTRICRIRGKIKRRMWIRENDIVLVAPWDFKNERADILWRYIKAHALWLDANGYIQHL